MYNGDGQRINNFIIKSDSEITTGETVQTHGALVAISGKAYTQLVASNLSSKLHLNKIKLAI
ncbi:hypothetical protein [Lactobacillus apis]|uniref:hypothetical protein n=1 Tax=Lactobacillus apis TaxID=303541 RepID=UPI00351AEE54